VGALSRAAARADEDLAPFLAPARRSYVLGGLAAAAARFAMWLLPELQARAPTLSGARPSLRCEPGARRAARHGPRPPRPARRDALRGPCSNRAADAPDGRCGTSKWPFPVCLTAAPAGTRESGAVTH